MGAQPFDKKAATAQYNVFMIPDRERLEGLLVACTREQLLYLARVFGLKGFSRLAKPGLVLMLLEKVAPGLQLLTP